MCVSTDHINRKEQHLSVDAEAAKILLMTSEQFSNREWRFCARSGGATDGVMVDDVIECNDLATGG